MDALDELLSDLQDLLEAQTSTPAPARADEGNFRCVRCEGCVDCRFCMECRDCDECTYCEGCEGCRGCTQCKLCRDCDRTSHSLLSRACDACSYVTLSIGCEECVHCFACVGLAGAEFCVLNERYSRRDYQTKVAELKAALEPRLAAGWRPPWWRDEDEAASARAEEASSAAPADEDEDEPEPAPESEDDAREPDAPTGGHRLEEAVAPRALDSVRLTTAAAPRPTHPDEAHTTSPGGPSVTRAHRPAAAAHPAASAPASVLTGRRPQRG